MFQFTGFPSIRYFIDLFGVWMTEVRSAGFPHSEIPGSMDMCSSPRLIAACHVLRRLLVPRHPPCALSCLISSAVFYHSALYSVTAIKSFRFCLDWIFEIFDSDVFDLKRYFFRLYLCMKFSRYVAEEQCSSLYRKQANAWFSQKILAATYSPGSSPIEYRRPLKP